jgi:hypothetical protein
MRKQYEPKVNRIVDAARSMNHQCVPYRVSDSMVKVTEARMSSRMKVVNLNIY